MTIKGIEKTSIDVILSNIERDKNITIHYACESGSRAWGFNSRDSDFDIRFIYSHPRRKYLSPFGIGTDVIEKNSNQKYDIVGWDISKTLNLFYSSNPNLHDWLFSPIIYKENKELMPILRALAIQYYSRKRFFYHHRGIIVSQVDKYIEGKEYVEIKKYLYILRSIASIRYIDTIETFPVPVDIENVIRLTFPLPVYAKVYDLIRMKEHTEDETVKSNSLLNKFIKENMRVYENVPEHFEDKEMPTQSLNFLYQAVIGEFI